MNKNLLSMGGKKIHRRIFYLLVFLMPSNLAKHWIQNWSYVNGVLVDYLIPTLYLTDILIGLLLIIWLMETIMNHLKTDNGERRTDIEKRKLKREKKSNNLFSVFKICLLFSILCFLIFNINNPVNKSASLYKLIKLLEFGALIIYIKYNININKDIKNIVKVLSLSVLWQSSLAILQWFKQGAIFGYWFFGEQPFNTASHGIKLVSWFGEMKAVPMGTFPHPNVLAGFLVISLISIISNIQYPISNQSQISNIKQNLISYILYLISCAFGAIALFLTFSFPAWFVFLCFLGCLSYLLVRKAGKKVIGLLGYWVIVLLVYWIIGLLLVALAIEMADPASLSRRFQLSEIALKMWLSAPLFGVGLNNFIPRMDEFGQVTANIRFLQPVHNIYLLALAEAGIIGFIGLIGLIWWLGKKLWKNRKNNSIVLLGYCFTGLLFLGFFDHYLLTIQQGMLVFSLIIGLSLNSQRNGNL